ncbi:MAG: ABC transporter substrate-binding protein [Proteobacteria bacterium]|nr:MAG: ABC transporter substrate-binding protein [Pseudomonadota bacterium]
MQIDRITRRDIIRVVGGAAAWPMAAHAQQATAKYRVGVLLVGLSPASSATQHFRRGLRDAGFFEGRDVAIEWRSAAGDYSRVPELAAELVKSGVDVIVQDSTYGTMETMRLTSTIPIVMALVVDPVGSGLVQSLSRPGGNVTGLSMMTSDLNSKRLQMLRETRPQLRRIAVLWNPDHPFHSKVADDLKKLAPIISIELSLAGVRKPEDMDAAFSEINATKAQALYVVEDPIFFSHRKRILELASKTNLPTIHELRRWPDEGALMSYGPDLYDLFRRSAFHVGKILSGTKPAEIPVEQPTKFEFVINLKTAKALELDLPNTMVALADEVIE